jgi:hypothetical protein
MLQIPPKKYKRPEKFKKEWEALDLVFRYQLWILKQEKQRVFCVCFANALVEIRRISRHPAATVSAGVP